MNKRFVGSVNKALKLFLYAVFIIVLLTAGIMTLMPAEASKVSYLGYYSTCAFAPFSTIILFSLAFIDFIFLRKLWKNLVRKSNKSIVYLDNEALIN